MLEKSRQHYPTTKKDSRDRSDGDGYGKSPLKEETKHDNTMLGQTQTGGAQQKRQETEENKESMPRWRQEISSNWARERS